MPNIPQESEYILHMPADGGGNMLPDASVAMPGMIITLEDTAETLYVILTAE